MSKVADIVKQATDLEKSERAKVISELLKTLDPPGEDVADFEAAWSDELDRRKREIEQGEVELVEWDEVRAGLRR